VSPFSPCGPAGPCGPVAPVAPVSPGGPGSPLSPFGPAGPVGPGIGVSAEPLPVVNPFCTQISLGLVQIRFEASCPCWLSNPLCIPYCLFFWSVIVLPFLSSSLYANAARFVVVVATILPTTNVATIKITTATARVEVVLIAVVLFIYFQYNIMYIFGLRKLMLFVIA
jgi:hypothetical protein